MALSEKDIQAKINTVIQGDYEGEGVCIKNNCVMVGEKIVTLQSCEKYEDMSEAEDTANVKKTKRGLAAKIIATALFPPAAIVTARSAYKDYYSFGKMIKLTWRNGQESLVFVDELTAAKIRGTFF